MLKSIKENEVLSQSPRPREEAERLPALKGDTNSACERTCDDDFTVAKMR